jgi:hypothetical protein
MWRDGSAYFHFTVRGALLYWRMYRMSFLFKSETEVNTPRAMTSRSISPNHSLTWLSHEEYVGVMQMNEEADASATSSYWPPESALLPGPNATTSQARNTPFCWETNLASTLRRVCLIVAN